MNLDVLIPEVTFTDAEMYELAQVLHTPVLRKYLKHLQTGCIKGIANGLPKPEETSESYVRRQAVVVGGLDALETLLKIEKPSQEASF